MSAPELLFEILPWDSEFFGFPIARSLVRQLTPSTAGRLITECEAAEVRCLYFLVEAGDSTTIALLENNEFGLKDLRLTLARKPGFTAARNEPVRVAVSEDLPALRRIARMGYRDSRFYADTGFPRARCDDLFDAWITNSVTLGFADAVLVVDVNGKASGFITCLMTAPERGQIGLFGVSEEVRGAGLGRKLIEQAMDWFSAKGAAEVVVVTQGKNLPAIRVYEKCGFLSSSMQLWYHRWF